MFLNLLIFIDLLFINSTISETPLLYPIEAWQTIKLQSIKNPAKKSTCVNEIIYEICDGNTNPNGCLPSKCGKYNLYSRALSRIPLKILYEKTKTTITENDCETETTMIKNHFTDETYERFKTNKTSIIKKTTYSGTLPYDFVTISSPFIYSKTSKLDGNHEFLITQYQRSLRTFECMFHHFFNSSIDAESYVVYLKNWKLFGCCFKEINVDPLRSKLLSIIFDLDTLNYIMGLIQDDIIDLGDSLSSIYDAFSKIAECCLQNIKYFEDPQLYFFQDITNLFLYNKFKTHRFQIFKFNVNVDESLNYETIFFNPEKYYE